MLTVRELMTPNPTTTTPITTLKDVVAIMNNDGYRQLPVLHGGKLVGIITDRDVRLAINSPVLDATKLTRVDVVEELIVADCMTPDPMTTTPNASAHTVAELLTLYKFGSLPVVDDGQVVGIISVSDFLRHFAGQGEMRG